MTTVLRVIFLLGSLGHVAAQEQQQVSRAFVEELRQQVVALSDRCAYIAVAGVDAAADLRQKLQAAEARIKELEARQ